MCKIHNPRVIDKCMRTFIEFLDELIERNDGQVVACCCGHGRYPMTIVVKANIQNQLCFWDIVNDVVIPRKRKFYKKDKEGYYYIPEVIERVKRKKT